MGAHLAWRESCRVSSAAPAGPAPETPRGWSWPALQITPPFGEGAGGHRRKVPRRRPLPEEQRQGADASVVDEGPLGQAGQAGAEAIEAGIGEHAREGLEQDALGPRCDALAI